MKSQSVENSGQATFPRAQRSQIEAGKNSGLATFSRAQRAENAACPNFRPPRSQRGFALLFVFALAASLAIVLYMELPVAAFEAQRLKEDLLVERGQQYVRAIKVYSRRFSKFPDTIDALENTNNIRYLRRRYKDPLTGKDDWRLLHANAGGVITDSLVNKVPGSASDKDKAKSVNTFITEGPSVSSNSSSNPAMVYTARRRRVRAVEPVASDAPDTQTPSPDPASGAPPPPPLPAPGSSPTTGPAVPGQPGTGTPNSALAMIQKLLTTPRPGGFPGAGFGGTQFGAGIAGVASKVDAEGIKLINERTNYKEWEFVYDLNKERAQLGGMGMGSAPSPTANPAGLTPGMPGGLGGGSLTSPRLR